MHGIVRSGFLTVVASLDLSVFFTDVAFTQTALKPCPPAVCVTADEGGSCTPPDADASCPIVGSAPPLEGYGTSSTFGGGPGSEVCTVTNLNNSGNGSLRDCVENRNGSNSDPVPRTIEFSVGGTITLTTDLRFRQPYITVDGFSAPSPGITIEKTGSGVDGETRIQTWPGANTCGHDILVQGIRFRGVWGRDTEDHSQNSDILNVDGEDLPGCLKNVGIWRNTLTDGQDAVGGFWGSVTDSTFAYNFVLYNHHPQQVSHAPGGVNGQQRERISLHHNIYAYAHERIPNIRGNAWDLHIVQNVFHKWAAFGFGGGYATLFRCRGSGCPQRINMIENHWTSGGTRLGNAIDFSDSASPSQVYMRGNIVPAAENNGGTAASEFTNTAPVTIYPDADFVNSMFPFIGHSNPTAEEAAVKQEVALQMQSEF